MHIHDIEMRADAAGLITGSCYYGLVSPADLDGVDLFGHVDAKTGELVGVVGIVAQGAQAYLDYLTVRVDYRDEGVATALLKEVARALRERGVRIVHTCVSGENGASIKLLQRHGAKIGWPYINGVIRLEDQNG